MSERDAISGAFKNDVGMGASTPEQHAAGVNPLDNEFSAASKINLHRNPIVHAPMDWAGLATFIRWAFVVFCALVVVWAAAAANE